MSGIDKERVLKIKSKNKEVQRNERWPLESEGVSAGAGDSFERSDDYYMGLANDHFGSSIRDNSRAEKIEIGKAIANGTIED